MYVTVRTGGSLLRKYVPQPKEVELQTPVTVKELLADLGIPDGLVAAVVINGEKSAKNYLLKGGEEVVLIPPITGG